MREIRTRLVFGFGGCSTVGGASVEEADEVDGLGSSAAESCADEALASEGLLVSSSDFSSRVSSTSFFIQSEV